MIKQSKTTIKELSAQYRAVLRHAFLAGVIALATSGAYADTDVTFAGNYTNTSGDNVNVNDAVGDVGYHYTNSAGGTVDVTSQSTDPNFSDFTYTDAEGNPADLTSGTNLTAADFSGTSAADGITVISNQTIAADEEISRDNYQYVNGAGETVTLGETAQTFTEAFTLNETYAAGASVDVTGGATTPVLSGTMYTYTDPETGAVYHVNASGDGVVDANNIVVTPDAGTALETACNAMIDAFQSDLSEITGIQTIVDGYAAAEETAFAAANTVYTTDAVTIDTLTTNYGTYTAAVGLLGDAQVAQAAAQTSYVDNSQDLADALAVYDESITTTITNGANAAIEASIESGSIQDALDATEQNAQGYTDEQINIEVNARNGAISNAKVEAIDEANGYTDDKIADEIIARNEAIATAKDEAIETANGYTDDKIADEVTARNEAIATAKGEAIEAANGYTDGKIADEATARETADAELQDAIEAETARATAAENALRNEFASGNTETLARANAYTDKKVNKLEKNVSGGIAAATALSSVEVSNVAKGEMSVGGGYGYYNDQSAVAVGAAMGLTDRWSINAGAGIATGDKTQVAFRAGTNYKFKLF